MGAASGIPFRGAVPFDKILLRVRGSFEVKMVGVGVADGMGFHCEMDCSMAGG